MEINISRSSYLKEDQGNKSTFEWLESIAKSYFTRLLGIGCKTAIPTS